MTGADLPGTFRSLVGEGGVLDQPADLVPYQGDIACRSALPILCAVRPRTVEEVSAVVRACAGTGAVLVPRGGGTGLAGGATPDGARPAVVVSLERMRSIRSVDPVGNTIVAEAGCPLQQVQQAAETAGRLLGLDHGGAGSSQIGGNLSTNAGGNNVLRYGMARDQVLGLEVVLANGEVLSRLSPLPKSNAGYDLKQLFLGAEGTLGLITAATLRLRPAPVIRVTAVAGLATLDAVMELYARAQGQLADAVSAFELIPDEGVRLHLDHSGDGTLPLPSRPPWLVLIEADSPSRFHALDAAMEALLFGAMDDGIVLDGVIAASQAQRHAFWRLREGIAVAMIGRKGALKSDTAVPVAAVARFVREAGAAVDRVVPGCVPVPFGHVGDGNIHFNVLPPPGMEDDRFRACWPDLSRAIEDASLALGGTVSAEHGIGLLKRTALARMCTPAELNLMRGLKAAIDPDGLFNPGKIVPA